MFLILGQCQGQTGGLNVKFGCKIISSLVSGGAITKPSLTLVQCIQQHVGGTSSNQTTLGLAVKLHHKHCSSELVKTLNEHGITSSYDEVLRFRKSVTKFVSDNQSDYHL